MESLDERRESERLGLDGEMSLRYGDTSVEGELLDISSGGALGRFSIKTGIPLILEKVTAEFTVGIKMIRDIEGIVIRLQAIEAATDSEFVKVAIKFRNLTSEKASQIRAVSSSLQA